MKKIKSSLLFFVELGRSEAVLLFPAFSCEGKQLVDLLTHAGIWVACKGVSVYRHVQARCHFCVQKMVLVLCKYDAVAC